MRTLCKRARFNEISVTAMRDTLGRQKAYFLPLKMDVVIDSKDSVPPGTYSVIKGSFIPAQSEHVLARECFSLSDFVLSMRH